MKLVLLRHGESEWNLSNRFTGWTDVDLSPNGRREAELAGQLMLEAGLDFDLCFTSYLKRAIHTLNLALAQMDREWLPVDKSWKLNERHYGALQGLNKAETAAKYGEEQVHIWRRSYGVPPPALLPDDERNPARLPMYRGVSPEALPLTESLQDTVARVIPYYHKTIWPRIAKGERVLIAAHGNSLRALAMQLEGMTPEAVISLDLPTGIPLVYELSAEGKVLSKAYLGDAEKVAEQIRKVTRQGKIESLANQGTAPYEKDSRA
ncbi:MAG: 2,3-diphosphoglycerate-dependent phosphoglycerate mutase [Eubacteriales bacterium]|nr:2,3-diphosphoglycerate-dependent phosphoglycerate mutase [Eubacteriales bacterium]